MGLRQRNVHKQSTLGEQLVQIEWPDGAAGSIETGAFRRAIYLTDVDAVDITEFGLVLTEMPNSSGTASISGVVLQSGADSVDLSGTGLTTFVDPGWGTLNGNIIRHAAFTPGEVVAGVVQNRALGVIQTIADTAKKGVAIVLFATMGGTVDATNYFKGHAYFRYRAYRNGEQP